MSIPLGHMSDPSAFKGALESYQDILVESNSAELDKIVASFEEFLNQNADYKEDVSQETMQLIQTISAKQPAIAERVKKAVLSYLAPSYLNLPDELLSVIQGTLPTQHGILAASRKTRDISYDLITSLNLAHKQISSAELYELLKKCKNVHTIIVPKNATDDHLKAIADSGIKLTHIDCTHCEKLTSVGFSDLFNRCKEFITSVDLSWTEITDADLKILENSKLQEFKVSGCKQLSSEAIRSFFKACRETLQLVDVYNTQATDVDLSELKETTTLSLYD